MFGCEDVGRLNYIASTHATHSCLGTSAHPNIPTSQHPNILTSHYVLTFTSSHAAAAMKSALGNQAAASGFTMPLVPTAFES